jgi:hypothetical protein
MINDWFPPPVFENERLTEMGFAVITSRHENDYFAYRGGTAHGQDGVTIRR